MVYVMIQYVFDPACLPAFICSPAAPLPQLQCTIYLAGPVPLTRVPLLCFILSLLTPTGLTHIILTLTVLICIHCRHYVNPTFYVLHAVAKLSFHYFANWHSHELLVVVQKVCCNRCPSYLY